jgi:small subunit ribosomal protein S5
MADQIQKPSPSPIAAAETRAPRRGPPSRPGMGGGRPGSGPRRGGGGRRPTEPKEFEQKILDLSRVTRVTAGGKRMSFRAALVVGDKKGRVGLGVAKGADVQLSLEKAYRQGKKHLVRVPIENETIPHAVEMKFGSAVVLIKPAPKGTGLKCGGAVRMVLELAGVPNAVSKVIRSSNKINIAQATLDAIRALRPSKRRETVKG